MILSRKVDESLIVSDNIIITIIGFRGDSVKIGIAAPREIPVDRLEVREAKERDARGGAE